jgi:TonB family protein
MDGMTRHVPVLLGALLAGCAASAPEPEVPAPVVEVAPLSATSAEPAVPEDAPERVNVAEQDVEDEEVPPEPEPVEATVNIVGAGLSSGTGLTVTGLGLGGGGTGIGTIGVGGSGMGSGYGRLGTSKAGPSVQTAPARLERGLSHEVVSRVVRSKLPRIKSCYERELLDAPGLEGRVAVKFVIGPDGSVRGATVTAGIHRDVDACVRKIIESMTFPRPSGGGDVSVTYPFIFKSLP